MRTPAFVVIITTLAGFNYCAYEIISNERYLTGFKLKTDLTLPPLRAINILPKGKHTDSQGGIYG